MTFIEETKSEYRKLVVTGAAVVFFAACWLLIARECVRFCLWISGGAQ